MVPSSSPTIARTIQQHKKEQPVTTPTADTRGPEGLTPKQQAFADHLLAIDAIKFGTFRLKLHEQQPNAPLSPIYVNLRMLRSYPAALDATVAALAEMIEADGVRCDCYADVPMAATPIVAVLSHLTRVPMITPREPRTHGLAAAIDGVFAAGATALVIDDLVSHADSKLEAAHVLEANGLRVRDVAVLIDREQGGPAQLAAAGYTLHAATRLSQLLSYYLRTGGIDAERHAEVTAYLAGTQS
jgi:uridine monophosphate synthetase